MANEVLIGYVDPPAPAAAKKESEHKHDAKGGEHKHDGKAADHKH